MDTPFLFGKDCINFLQQSSATARAEIRELTPPATQTQQKGSHVHQLLVPSDILSGELFQTRLEQARPVYLGPDLNSL